ncbi:MAG: leucine-rich repeat domain-containing protein [Eubacterium sp.]|nr:leucine-rich repeat domain-containing protein [Eubacterium sp.]
MKKKSLITAATMLVATAMIALPGVAHAEKSYTENDITYDIRNGKAVLTGSELKGDTLNIPREVNGYRVVGIESYALDHSKYSKITIPNTVTKIGYSALSDSDKLTSITIPNSVKKIDTYAFSGCGRLKSVKLSNKLKTIESSLFSNCLKLKSISLPANVTFIGYNAFRNCYKLEKVSMGNKVSEIDSSAFENAKSLKSIVIPSSVVRVRDWAFSDCEELKKVVFKGAKTRLKKSIFYGCKSLEVVKLPKKLTNIPEQTFKNSGLKKFKLPSNASIIKASAFAGCKRLKTVKMNSKIYAIGDSAFAGSTLKSLKLNKRMQYIGNSAFKGTNIKHVSLPGKVSYIGNKVFGNCTKMHTISIPSSVKGINPGAFNNCEKLRAINVAAGNNNYSSQAGVLYNKNKTKLIQYPLNKKSASFTVPSSVTSIRDYAFANNANVKNVTINSGKIGYCSFYNMPKLSRVTVGSGVKKISAYAFSDCESLKTANLSDGINKIGKGAFANTDLRVFHIPSSLGKFDISALRGCNKIREFQGGSSKFKVENGLLYNGAMTKLIRFPSKKKMAVYEVPNSVTAFGGRAIHGVSSLRKISFGKKIKKLPYACISSCPNLKSVVFSTGTKLKNGSSAITSCTHLAVIVGKNNYTFKAMARNAEATLITL